MSAADGKVIILNGDGQINVIDASPAGYNDGGRNWITPITNFKSDGEYVAPVLADGRLYCRGVLGELRCLKIGDGSLPDTDADGLPDPWEQRYYQSRYRCDPGSDTDTDHQSAEREFVVGTDPTNTLSRLETRIELGPDGPRVLCEGREATDPWYDGLARLYSLKCRTNLLEGTWEDVAGYTSMTGLNATIVYTNVTPGVSTFYRFDAWLE